MDSFWHEITYPLSSRATNSTLHKGKSPLWFFVFVCSAFIVISWLVHNVLRTCLEISASVAHSVLKPCTEYSTSPLPHAFADTVMAAMKRAMAMKAMKAMAMKKAMAKKAMAMKAMKKAMKAAAMKTAMKRRAMRKAMKAAAE